MWSRIKEDWQLVIVAVVVCGIHGEKKFLISFEFEKNILTQNAYIKLKDRFVYCVLICLFNFRIP